MSPVHISPSTSVQKLERAKQKQGPGVGAKRVLNRILYSHCCGSYRCNTNKYKYKYNLFTVRYTGSGRPISRAKGS